jgi:NCS1 family nucleobase:cation symporter-1
MASISLGERSVRMIERVGIVLVMLLVVWESVVVFQHASLSAIMAWRPAAHFKMSSGAAVDVLAAFNLAWVTAAADFSRFGKTKTAATTWSFLGANLGLFWFAFIGLTATIAAAITTGAYDPNASDPSTIATKLGLGILALLVIVITSTTANAVNLMAAGSAVTNMFHRLKLTPALWLVTAVATAVSFVPLFFATFLSAFTAFLDMIGMFLGPEIAVFLVDFFILSKRRYVAEDMTRVNGQYWYRGGFNLVAIASWALGVAIYFGLRHVEFIASTVGATFVGMALTAVIYYCGMRMTRRNLN